MDRMIIVVLLLALGYFAVDKFVLAPGRIATSPAAVVATDDTSAAAGAGTTQQPNPGAASGDAAAKPIVRGIAVLPFANLSPDPDNAYFAGGVYEEVLTKLSRIGELRVISRTSMERIAEEKLEIGAIGARLGVSHVLEGSVRRAGDQIRVTVQLIEAATDAHLWAENYDRQLDDVFAIQSEIALAIADQLKLTLSPELQANLGERPTQNQAAYALYLRALEERGSWRGESGFRAMIDLLEPAVAADPDFLEARVLLADAHGRMVWLGVDPEGSHAGRAQGLVADIVRRWPERPESRLAQGHVLYNLDRDYEQALVHFQAVSERLPNHSGVLRQISNCFKRLSRNEEFLAVSRKVIEIDPESSNHAAELTMALLANHQFDEAFQVAERARSRFPKADDVLIRWAEVSLVRDQDITPLLDIDSTSRDFSSLADTARFIHGDFDALARAPSHPDESANSLLRQLIPRIELLRLAGRHDAAQAFTDQARVLIEGWSPATTGPEGNALAASVWALVGEPGRAREHLARARIQLSEKYRTYFERSIPAVYYLADAERLGGDPEAAWLLLQAWAGQPHILSHGQLLAFQPYYDQVYGESPSYRAYMAKIAGEKKK